LPIFPDPHADADANPDPDPDADANPDPDADANADPDRERRGGDGHARGHPSADELAC
jgi:hypothetical protein